MKEFPLAFVQECIALTTSGFGLVVALAWNEFVKDIISKHIQPYFGDSSGSISKLIYALVMTFLAVLVTMQLVRIEQKLQGVLLKPVEPQPVKLKKIAPTRRSTKKSASK